MNITLSFILYYFLINIAFTRRAGGPAGGRAGQGHFALNGADNAAQAQTLHSVYKMSYSVLGNRFRLDWAVTFPCAAEGTDPTQTFLIFMGLFEATQGRSRCSPQHSLPPCSLPPFESIWEDVFLFGNLFFFFFQSQNITGRKDSEKRILGSLLSFNLGHRDVAAPLVGALLFCCLTLHFLQG